MEELFMEACYGFQRNNYDNLEQISYKLHVPSKEWEIVKKKLIDYGLYTEEDCRHIEEIHTAEPFEFNTVPSFILERSMIVSDNSFIRYDSGIVFMPSYDDKANNTYTVNNGIIAYKDNDGIVRITPYSGDIAKFLTYGCNFRETHDLFVPLSNGVVEKFANSELQEQWERLNEVKKLYKKPNFDMQKYYESKGITPFLIDIAFGVLRTTDAILKELNDKVWIDEETLQKICEMIDRCGKSLTKQAQLRKEKRKELLKQVIPENPDLQTYQNWLKDINGALEKNTQNFAYTKLMYTYLSQDEVLTHSKLSFQQEKNYIANARYAISCAKKIGLDIKEDIADVNKKLLPYGISLFDLFDRPEENTLIQSNVQKDRQNKRIFESMDIDNYLGQSIESYFEDDIVMTNINRLLAIIQNADVLNDIEAKQHIQNLFDQLMDYLNIHYSDYKSQLQASGIDVEKHLLKINQKLQTIGLSLDDLQKNETILKHEPSFHLVEQPKDVYQKFIQRETIHSYLKKYFDVDIGMEAANNPVSQMLREKIIIENFLLEEYGKNGETLAVDTEAKNSYGENFKDFLEKTISIIGSLDYSIASSLNRDYVKSMMLNGGNWPEQEREINSLLSILGMSVSDFLKAGTIKSSSNFNMEGLGVSPETFIELCKQKEKEQLVNEMNRILSVAYAKEVIGPYKDNYQELLQSLDKNYHFSSVSRR